MATCLRCGKEVGGSRAIVSPICPECELVEIQKKQAYENEQAARERERADERAAREREWAEKRAERERERAQEAQWELERQQEEIINLNQELLLQRERQHNELKASQEQDQEFNASKPRCKWCGRVYTFRDGEGCVEYCSKKCALDDLKNEDYEEYLKQAPQILTKLSKIALQDNKPIKALLLSEGLVNIEPDLKAELGHKIEKVNNRNISQEIGSNLLLESIHDKSLVGAKYLLESVNLNNANSDLFHKVITLVIPLIHHHQIATHVIDQITDLRRLCELELLLHEKSAKISPTYIQTKKNDIISKKLLNYSKNAKTPEDFFQLEKIVLSKTNGEFFLNEKYFQHGSVDGGFQKYMSLPLEITSAADKAKQWHEAAINIKIDIALEHNAKAETYLEYQKVAELFQELANFNVENADVYLKEAQKKSKAKLEEDMREADNYYNKASSLPELKIAKILLEKLSRLGVQTANAKIGVLQAKIDKCNKEHDIYVKKKKRNISLAIFCSLSILIFPPIFLLLSFDFNFKNYITMMCIFSCILLPIIIVSICFISISNKKIKKICSPSKWFFQAAEQGDATAQYNLGVCYENGDGVAKDAQEAVKWYRLAAEQGAARAQYNLGVCYHDGYGVAKDAQEAVKWFHLVAEKDDIPAQHALGTCYLNGDGVAKDAQEAVKWFRLAAEQGAANAQSMLGYCYFNGYGVAKDKQEAVKWFRLAAEQGSAIAQYDAAERGRALAQYALGICYLNGYGVAKDKQEAVKWFRLAAEQGIADAVEALRKLLKH